MQPKWLGALREAAFGVSADDVAEIVKGLLAEAKAGDTRAAKFVFDVLLGERRFKGATFIQNVYEGGNGGGRPDEPSDAPPGSEGKIELMRRRVEAGLDTDNGADGRPDLS